MNRLLLFLLFISTNQLSAQTCFTINNCPTNGYPYCNTDPNSPLFWNEWYWSNPLGGTDLNEAPIEMTLPVIISCPGTTLSFRYLLFLDLDGDDIRETVVDSDALPDANTVNFGNAGNPNYSGGDPSAFDERPVAANQKFGFALETKFIDTNAMTASLRWNTVAAPNTYELPKLPPGRHKIKWFVNSNMGEQKTCEYEFVVKKDCLKPTVVCINGLSTDILPTTFVTLWTPDFLQYAEDNVTPANQLEFALRRSGTGTGFPEDSLGNPLPSLTFTCFDLGLQTIELWARDQAGNVDYCETYVNIQDNPGNCIGVIATVQPDAPFRSSVPNPFSDRLRIDLHTERSTTLSIRLSDPTGREMLLHRENIGAGEHVVELPAAHLPDGVYFLSISDETGVRLVKSLVKRSF